MYRFIHVTCLPIYQTMCCHFWSSFLSSPDFHPKLFFSKKNRSLIVGKRSSQQIMWGLHPLRLIQGRANSVSFFTRLLFKQSVFFPPRIDPPSTSCPFKVSYSFNLINIIFICLDQCFNCQRRDRLCLESDIFVKCLLGRKSLPERDTFNFTHD